MASREGAIVKKGHEEGLKFAVSLMEEFELPVGLLPLADVTEVGFVRETGYMWINQEKKFEHVNKISKDVVSYDCKITSYLEKCKIKKLEGVKAKEMMIWVPVNEIKVVDGKVHLKTFAGITKTHPVEVFASC